MNVLLVDDEVRVVESLERTLVVDGAADWTIHSATSGAGALDILAAEAIDVVVSDMRMPGMSGDQLLRRVRAEWPTVTRIVLSGHSEHNAELRAERLAHQFLGKPCNASVLVSALEGIAIVRAALTDTAGRAALSWIAAGYRVPAAVAELARADVGAVAGLDVVATFVRRQSDLAWCLLPLAQAPDQPLTSDLRAAIGQLGARGARAIALRLAHEALAAGVTGDHLPRPVRVAVLAQRLVPAEHRATTLFTAALHDLGEVVLRDRDPHVDRGPAGLDEVSVAPAHVAGYLLALWGLPPQVVDAVVRFPGPFAEPPSPVVAAVQVAVALISGRSPDPACLAALGQPAVPEAWQRWARGER